MIYNGYEIKNFTDLTDAEAIQVLEARNSEHVRRWMVNQSPINLRDHIQFLKDLKNTNEKKYYLAKKDNQFIGVYSIVGLIHGQGQGGFYLSDYAVKAELTIEFLYTMIDYLFQIDIVNKIFGFAMIDNKNVNKINILLGFREDHALNLKKQKDYIYTSLSKSDWINVHSKNPKLLNILRVIKGFNNHEN
jgi:RimJ/RimL family protein N-acetyltransferase